MCGIAGTLNFSDRPVDAAAITRMVSLVEHRGPDASSVMIDGRIGLGHTRLSIIDVEGGHQPMPNADGTLWITFNGEIFNYVEIRNSLAARGHVFATRSDTEVILHLYEEYGTDCVQHLNGQWSFGIWDARQQLLFLSRDRMGVRPLFYTVAGDAFLFASEIKALFTNPRVHRAIDIEALDQFFTFWAPQTPKTLFEGVYELPPGHSMIVRNSVEAPTCHWQPHYDLEAASMSERDAADRLLELLIDATRIRLRADVPVGAYLSGGLDSTVITALIKQFTSTPLRTFSLGFEDEEFDETEFQRLASAELGTDHEAIRCSASDIAAVFPDVVWHAEKPMLRTAPAPMYLLARLVRQRGFKVVLTGEGSDEVFGGYDIFKETKIRRFWSAVPDSRLRPLLLRRLYPYMKNIQSQPEAYLRAFFMTRAEDCGDPFFSHLPRWSLASKLKLFYSADLRARLGEFDAIAGLRDGLPSDYARWDGFSRAQYLETAHLLPGYILSSQGDRMAMAHAVEGRFPFLDHRVVEFAAALPPTLKMKVLNEKYLLKRAVRGLIPEAVRARKKQPYRAPDAKSFFAAGQLVDYAAELLSPARLQADGLFNPAAVAGLVAKAKSGAALGVKDNMGLVGILSTEILTDRFIRNFSHADHSGRSTHVHHRQLSVRTAL